MAIRKKDIQSSKNRVRRRTERIIDNPWFRENVVIARDLTGVNRTNRDNKYNKFIERFKRKDLENSRFSEDVIWYRNHAITMLYSLLPVDKKLTCKTIVLLLANDGIPVTEQFFFAALCHDFEGTERDEFVDYMLDLESPVHIRYWYQPMASFLSYKKWQEQEGMKANRIYLDVTGASLDDIAAVWNEVATIKNRLDIPGLSPGRPYGTTAKSLEDRDKKVWEIYQGLKATKGYKRRHTRRHEGLYDLISRLHGQKMNLPSTQYLPKDTVKRIVAKMKRKQNCNSS